MRRKIKSFIFFVLPLLLCVTVLASCDNNIPSETTQSTSASDFSDSEESSAVEETTISTEESTSDTEVHQHIFGEWTVTQQATCTEKGEQERVCV